MFFKKKKPKLDPKVRFQNRQFNQKLQQARTFKRTARPIPEGGLHRFLMRIGLGSRWRQAFVIVIAGALVYLVYIPNFLSWKEIEIEGMKDADRIEVLNAINSGFDDASFVNPQHNMLFVSNARIREAIAKVGAVDHVNFIKRDFKNYKIKISITSKYERFLVRSNDAVYDVYNDGATKGQAGVDRNYWESLQNPSMVKIEVQGKITNPDNKEFLTKSSVDYLNTLQDNIKNITGSTLLYAKIDLPEFRAPASTEQKTEKTEQPESTEKTDNSNNNKNSQTDSQQNTNSNTNPTVEDSADLVVPFVEPVHVEVQLPLNADEVELVMQKGNDPKRTFRVIIDTQESPQNLVGRLNLLLSQTAADRYDKLSYIDMRIQTRAFVCLLGTTCSN